MRRLIEAIMFLSLSSFMSSAQAEVAYLPEPRCQSLFVDEKKPLFSESLEHDEYFRSFEWAGIDLQFNSLTGVSFSKTTEGSFRSWARHTVKDIVSRGLPTTWNEGADFRFSSYEVWSPWRIRLHTADGRTFEAPTKHNAFEFHEVATHPEMISEFSRRHDIVFTPIHGRVRRGAGYGYLQVEATPERLFLVSSEGRTDHVGKDIQGLPDHETIVGLALKLEEEGPAIYVLTNSKRIYKTSSEKKFAHLIPVDTQTDH